MTSRIDTSTGQAAERAAQLLVVAVRVLRIPTAILFAFPLPFIVVTAIVAIAADGAFRVVGLVVAVAMAAVAAAFGWRRHQVVKAVDDPVALATELGIMVEMSDRADETRGILQQIAGGGGSRVFSRLRGAWRGVTMPARWIEGVEDLRRARNFAPPRIGWSISLTIAALWLVPISMVVALFALIGALAGSL
ncbi:hypothetical protein [Aeromicrobium sp. Leaf350]|uniref:hypothetical protein n=1 Tax=Aeromicrobium sp. Leaf350 TaxID=2876565 RepID=UPI001E5C591E|nr:hypothetical protein [Aeromicrobium sp. Leaf350]